MGDGSTIDTMNITINTDLEKLPTPTNGESSSWTGWTRGLINRLSVSARDAVSRVGHFNAGSRSM